MKIKITQYGLSKKAGGWDPDGDSSTDQLLGNRNNQLNWFSCALTKSAAIGLGNPSPGAKLKIVFPDGTTLFRHYDDTAPEEDPRLDLFMPNFFDHTIPADFAEVTPS